MAERVQEVRLEELACVKRALLLKSFNLLTLFLWPVVVSMVTFIVYIFLGNRLTVVASITILAFVNVLARPITVLPMALISVAEVRVSINRIEKYLLQDELQSVDKQENEGGGDGDQPGGPDGAPLVTALRSNAAASGAPLSPRGMARGHKVQPSDAPSSAMHSTASASGVALRTNNGGLVAQTPSSAGHALRSNAALGAFEAGSGGGRPVIEVKDGSFAWERAAPPTLTEINFSVRPGALVGVIGSVGAGKSSLLSAILGEMHPIRGTVSVRGRVGYMAQQPWIQNCTVRDNILFGLPFDEVRYHATLAAACLTTDMATFKEGDQTEIGERGITMSGGQKARVSLARAVYRAALCDIYLLDDPFAAVDVHVGTSMFFESVAGVLRQKTRVVVLNSHLHLLRHFDEIIVVETDSKSGGSVGGIAARGTFAQMEKLYPALLAQQQLRSQVAAASATGGAPTAALLEIKEEELSKNSDGIASGRNHHRRKSSVEEFFVPSDAGGVQTTDKRRAAAQQQDDDVAFLPSDHGTRQVSRQPSRNTSRQPSVAAPSGLPHKSPSTKPLSTSGSRRGSGAGLGTPVAASSVVQGGQFQSPMDTLALHSPGETAGLGAAAQHGADEGDEGEDMALFSEPGGARTAATGAAKISKHPSHLQHASRSFAPLDMGDAAYTNSVTNVGFGRYMRTDTATSGVMSPTPDERVNMQFLASGKGPKKHPGSLAAVADSGAPSPSPSPKSPEPLLGPSPAPGLPLPVSQIKELAKEKEKGDKPASLMTKEDRASGSVGFGLYRYYFDMAAMGHVPDLLDIDEEPDNASTNSNSSSGASSVTTQLPGANSARASTTLGDDGRTMRQSSLHPHGGSGSLVPANGGGSKSSTPSANNRDGPNGQMLLAAGKDADSVSPPPTLALPSPEAAAAASAPAMDVEASAAVVSTTYAGIAILVGMLALFILCQVVRIGCDLWLTNWGDEQAANSDEALAAAKTPPTEHSVWFWVIGCGIFASVTFTLVGLRAWLFVRLALRVSDRMHRSLLRKLLLAPITTFYDVTPLGRILNRLSKDFDQVDSFCPDLMAQLFQHSFNLLGGLALSVTSTYFYALVLVPIFLAFGKLQAYFRLSSRELKRLEGVTRSPIFSTFGETLLGLATIRAYRVQEAFVQKQRDFIQTNAKIYTSFYLTSRWLSLRLDFISNFLVLAVGAFGLGLRSKLDTGLIGLALLYTLQFTGFLQWTVRVSVDTENSFTAVERLSHYNHLPREAPYVVRPEQAPPKGWPAKGDIVFNNLMMRYRPELPYILKGVSCSIKAREKIGICGRTGSGTFLRQQLVGSSLPCCLLCPSPVSHINCSLLFICLFVCYACCFFLRQI
jgi:ABC-type multidrug transport system fused ATPase/permease subunit